MHKRTPILIGTCIPGDAAESMIPHAANLGFESVSVNFHMSIGDISLQEQGRRLRDIAQQHGIKISAVGYYCNPIQYQDHEETLKHVITCAGIYGADIVSTFAGAYEGRPVEEALPKFGEVFTRLARHAEENGVKLAIENCPMGGTWGAATCNIGFNPAAWERMFELVPSDSLGIEWEPAHQMAQLISPLPQLREWIGKIVHIHGKDATVDINAVQRRGILMPEHEYVWARTPGYGDTNWRDIFSILYAHGYQSDICVEGFHDRVYNGAWESTSQKHALEYLKWCRGGDFIPNAWEG